jgi:hypothetical protein
VLEAWPMRIGLFVVTLASLAGCTSRDPKQTCEGAVSAFLEATERLSQSSYRALALELVDETSRDVLEARARSAESLSHRPFTGPDMFVPTPGALAFAPERIRDEDVSVQGDRAFVTLRGKKRGELARVECVREDDGWHVVLGLEHEAPETIEPRVIRE